MEIKEFDTQLMELAHEFRKCREITTYRAKEYPEHVNRFSEALSHNMQHSDLIIGQLRSMLHESRKSLEIAQRTAEFTAT